MNIKYFKLSNNSGFSMMEIIILASVSLVAMMAFSTYVASQKSGAREIVQNIEAAGIQSLVADLLSDPNACLNNFLNDNVNVLTQKAVVVDAGGANIYTPATAFRGGNLRFLRLEKLPANPPMGPSTTGQVRVSLILQKKGTAMGMNELQVIIPMQVTVNAARNITACTATMSGGVAQCVYPVQTCGSCTQQTVSCPVNYKVTGGGIYDGGMGKGRYYSYPINPPGGSFGTGGWRCRTSGNNTQRCYAICCLSK